MASMPPSVVLPCLHHYCDLSAIELHGAVYQTHRAAHMRRSVTTTSRRHWWGGAGTPERRPCPPHACPRGRAVAAGHPSVQAATPRGSPCGEAVAGGKHRGWQCWNVSRRHQVVCWLGVPRVPTCTPARCVQEAASHPACRKAALLGFAGLRPHSHPPPCLPALYECQWHSPPGHSRVAAGSSQPRVSLHPAGALWEALHPAAAHRHKVALHSRQPPHQTPPRLLWGPAQADSAAVLPAATSRIDSSSAAGSQH